ncbi:MAG TPA: hypothetical protein VG963_27005 [Polyangiaceae bacterium]|nr:hypothetical protein [Polyangiaceae bacterium]
MLRSASRMLGYRLSASDGEIGQCLDLLLDERSWVIRHIVVKGVARFGGQRLSISPLALPKAEWQFRRWVFEGSSEWLGTPSASGAAEAEDHFMLPPPLVEARAEAFEDSAIELVPELLDELDADFDDALDDGDSARTRESGVIESESAFPMTASQVVASRIVEAEIAESLDGRAPKSALNLRPPSPASQTSTWGRHLSLVELLGHAVEAAEGDHVGQIADVISNDDSWICPYLVLSDLTSAPGREVLVPTDWVRSIDPAGRRVQLFASIAQVRSEPDFRPESMPRVLGAATLERSLLPAPPVQPSSAPAWAQALSRGARGIKAAFARTLHGRAR